MKPNGGEPSGKLLELINRDFGSYHTFVNEFKAAATIQVDSCWAWLICNLKMRVARGFCEGIQKGEEETFGLEPPTSLTAVVRPEEVAERRRDLAVIVAMFVEGSSRGKSANLLKSNAYT